MDPQMKGACLYNCQQLSYLYNGEGKAYKVEDGTAFGGEDPTRVTTIQHYLPGPIRTRCGPSCDK